MKLSPTVQRAIKSGHTPKLRDWRSLEIEDMTIGEKCCSFIETFIHVPEGELVGQKMRLLEFQEVFIQSIFDGDVRARKAILSVGRKAGKTTVISALMICFMLMKDLLKPNSRINSGALSKDQSALVFNYMSKSLMMSPDLKDLVRIIPSGKRIQALTTGIEYQALAADSHTTMGLSPAVFCGDEWGSVVGTHGPQYDFIQSLMTSQGAHANPLAIVISTSAASDSDWLSLQIDDATRSPSNEVVCHYYTADKELAIDDPVAWEQACPSINHFRSSDDIKLQAEQALRMPSAQASFENLMLNRRVASTNLWISPTLWKENSGAPDMELFKTNEVHFGLDLSQLHDLTAAVASVMDDDGNIHIFQFVFSPKDTLFDRASRDRAPYPQWEKDGFMIAPYGKTLDYDWVCQYLVGATEGWNINSINFDRWRIDSFKKSAEDCGFASGANWFAVGQGFKDISPRMEKVTELLLNGKLRHGGHPLLNLGAGHAISVVDPAGNTKISKQKATQRVDQIVALVMSVYACAVNLESEIDVDTMIFGI